MTGKSDIGGMWNFPSHLSQPSRSGNRLFCSSYGQRGYPAISPRKIAILEQNQRRTRKIPSHTAPRVRCPPYCRLWAGVWPRRAEVGCGYHPACLGACRGAFRCAEKAAGERGGVVCAPTPVTSAHSAGSCGIPPPALWSGVFGGQWGRKQKKSRSYGTTCGVTAKF